MYLVKVGPIRHTAADAAGSAVWAMHLPHQGANTVKYKKGIYVREIHLTLDLDTLPAAAAAIGYELWRFSVADPTTGSTVARIKSKTSGPASVVADANIQQKSGILTMTSVVYDTDAFAALIKGGQITTATAGQTGPVDMDLSFPTKGDDCFEILPDQGLAIRVASGIAAVIGQILSGYITFDEREIR